MPVVMNRATFKRNMQLGLNAQFGLEYPRHQSVYPSLFEVSKEGSRAWLDDLLMVGLPIAPKKGEGQPVEYFAGGEGWVAHYLFESYGMAFQFTEEAEDDGLYGSLIAKYGKFAARSFAETMEVLAADIYNFAFDSNHPGGDGVSLLSTAHPLRNGGVGSNAMTAADLSEESLEDLIVAVGEVTDDQGIPINLSITSLCVANPNRFNAIRLMYTDKRPGTMMNDVNAVRQAGSIQQQEAVVNVRFTDPDAWFARTNCPDGLKFIERQPIRKKMDGDFETGNLRWRLTWRGVAGWTNWRGLFGNPGN